VSETTATTRRALRTRNLARRSAIGAT